MICQAVLHQSLKSPSCPCERPTSCVHDPSTKSSNYGCGEPGLFRFRRRLIDYLPAGFLRSVSLPFRPPSSFHLLFNRGTTKASTRSHYFTFGPMTRYPMHTRWRGTTGGLGWDQRNLSYCKRSFHSTRINTNACIRSALYRR